MAIFIFVFLMPVRSVSRHSNLLEYHKTRTKLFILIFLHWHIRKFAYWRELENKTPRVAWINSSKFAEKLPLRGPLFCGSYKLHILSAQRTYIGHLVFTWTLYVPELHAPLESDVICFSRERHVTDSLVSHAVHFSFTLLSFDHFRELRPFS